MLRSLTTAAVIGLSTCANGQTCSITEVQKLLAETPWSNGQYGFSVDVAGDVMVIGIPRADLPGQFVSAGAAEVWERVGGVWQRSAVLRSDTPAQNSFFGDKVATDGSVVLVGAHFEPVTVDETTLTQAGAVYVFEKIAGEWTSVQRLISNEPQANEQFGGALALDPGGLIVGAPNATSEDLIDSEAGAVHVFLRSGNSFSHADKIQVPEASFRAKLGTSVAFEAGVIVAGAPAEDGGGNDSGAVYVFAQDGTWQVIDKLQAPTARTRANFGWSVDMRLGEIVVGSLDHFFGSGQGSAFSFTQISTGNWEFAQQFNGASTLSSDEFGVEVRFIGDTSLAIGATLDDDGGPQTGSVFLFEKQGGTWTQTGSPFGNADRASGDQFGLAIASDGDVMVISATGNDDGAFGAGSAHVFDLVCSLPCPADIADTSGFGPPDDQVDFGDFFALSFLAGPCGGGTTNPDCTGDLADSTGFGAPDGTIDFGDFFAMSFAAGPCP